VHQAYLPIVAASTRAATLHYCCNDREFAWGPLTAHDHANHVEFAHAALGSRQLLPQVLLIDAGCEWNNYASDSMSPYAKISFSVPLTLYSYTDNARG
jgi:Xaa-Pro dipeptidase